jgi:hypothetical protein
MTNIFRWYVTRGDGTADCYESDPPTLTDTYGTPEGAIIHGGVIATAFERKTEEVFDAMEAILHGRRVSRGFRTTTRITACPQV